MILRAVRSRSTNTARSQPRLRASMPRAPVPAYRSSATPPSKNWPRKLKTASRTLSPVGRTPFGTGARRTPPAVPAMILKALLSEEPLDVGAEELSDLAPQRSVVRAFEGRVLGDEGEGLPPRLDEQVYVPE